MFGNKDSITSDKLADALAPLVKRIEKLEAELKKIKADNKSLTDKLSALEKDLSTLKNSKQDAINGANGELKHIFPSPIGEMDVAAAPPRGEAVSAEATFFLPSPTSDGTFLSASPEEEIGKSIYLLTTEDGEHGTFELLQSSDAMATAAISVSQFLKPVCRINGDTHHMPDRIENVEKGEAQKKDGMWVVTKKAVISFQ